MIGNIYESQNYETIVTNNNRSKQIFNKSSDLSVILFNFIKTKLMNFFVHREFAINIFLQQADAIVLKSFSKS